MEPQTKQRRLGSQSCVKHHAIESGVLERIRKIGDLWAYFKAFLNPLDLCVLRCINSKYKKDIPPVKIPITCAIGMADKIEFWAWLREIPISGHPTMYSPFIRHDYMPGVAWLMEMHCPVTYKQLVECVKNDRTKMFMELKKYCFCRHYKNRCIRIATKRKNKDILYDIVEISEEQKKTFKTDEGFFRFFEYYVYRLIPIGEIKKKSKDYDIAWLRENWNICMNNKLSVMEANDDAFVEEILDTITPDDPESFFVCNVLVVRKTRNLWDKAIQRGFTYNSNDIMEYAIEEAPFDLLEELHRSGAVLTPQCAYKVAKDGYWDRFEWLLERKCPMDICTAIRLIELDKLDLLKKYRARGFPVDGSLYGRAIKYQRDKILEFLDTQNIPFNFEDIYRAFSKKESSPYISYLDKTKDSLTPSYYRITIRNIIALDCLIVLHWLIENGFELDYPDLLRDAAIKGAYKTVEWAVKKGYKWTNPTGDFDPCTDLENFELLLKCGFVVTQHTFRLAILWEKRDVLICLKRYGYKCNDENFARAIDTNYEVAWWLKYFMGPFDKELETKFFLCETKKWMEAHKKITVS